jgi:hypothetical protein
LPPWNGSTRANIFNNLRAICPVTAQFGFLGGKMPIVSFRQRDLIVAIKAAKAAGLPIARIEVRQDGAHLIIGEPQAVNPEADDDAAHHAQFQENLRRAFPARKGRGEMSDEEVDRTLEEAIRKAEI